MPATTPRTPLGPTLVGACLSLLLAAGCAPGGNDESAADDPAPGPDMEVPVMKDSTPPSGGPDRLDEATDAARADLAGRMDIDASDIDVVERRYVTWRNGAMGCPEPDMMYTQALVPGVWIRLAIGDRRFDYHGGRSGSPFLCPAERAEAPLPADDAPLA
ncbi:hypothetical protein [Halomonas denitrificans]|nr:hypothetical protein [Halomonas denitrificans]